jgi:hypothetical protein
MRLEWAIPCGSVRIEDDGRVSAIEDFGFDTIIVDPFPSTIELIVLIRAVGLPDDFAEDADRTVDAFLLGPGMDPLLSLEFEIRSGEPRPGYLEGWEMNAVIPLFIEFTPRAEGTHSLDLYLHGRVQPCTVPLRVLASPPDSN